MDIDEILKNAYKPLGEQSRQRAQELFTQLVCQSFPQLAPDKQGQLINCHVEQTIDSLHLNAPLRDLMFALIAEGCAQQASATGRELKDLRGEYIESVQIISQQIVFSDGLPQLMPAMPRETFRSIMKRK